MKFSVVVLTGAGISAESGLRTFRDANGLWEGHNVMDVASPQGFADNPALVLDFYNQRRSQLKKADPNLAHRALVDLETISDVTIITQNVDDLHERAGSSNVVHLHGELFKVRSTDGGSIQTWEQDLNLGDTCANGHQLRPHIVWFGEEVPMMEKAVEITRNASVLLIIGTSMQVYPAASLINCITRGTPIYFIDPNPTVNENDLDNLTIIPKKATIGVPIVVDRLIGTMP